LKKNLYNNSKQNKVIKPINNNIKPIIDMIIHIIALIKAPKPQNININVTISNSIQDIADKYFFIKVIRILNF
jgi:hypothetical protein